MLNTNLVLLVFSLDALTLLFSFFCFANSFVLYFLRVHVSVLGGADSLFFLHREPNVNFITEDVFASNI